MVESFETKFRIEHLYYAHYSTLEASSIEVSAATKATDADICQFFKRTKGVTRVKVEFRGTGSLAHAYAYQAVKRIVPYAKDLADDIEFLDVIHWMCNQRGLDYLREARLYQFGALRLVHQQALEQDKALRIMRELVPEVEKVTKRLTNEDRIKAATETALALAKVDESHARLSKLKRSLNVASRKVVVGRDYQNALSGRRSPARRGRGRLQSKK